VQLTLLSRAYCHLCEEMHAALAPIAAAHGATIAVVDVDADPALEEQWGERVPALFVGEPAAEHLVCHYHLDATAVIAALSAGASVAERR
jgi:glutaredoxin